MANRIPLEQRLRRLINRVNGCWEWQGRITYQGYGQTSTGYRTENNRKTRPAHIVSYETFVGKVPEGLTLDHLCRNRSCINPDHLEPVTVKENIRRGVPFRDLTKYGRTNAEKLACKLGHPLDYFHATSGKRGCRTCRNNTATLWQLAKKGI